VKEEAYMQWKSVEDSAISGACDGYFMEINMNLCTWEFFLLFIVLGCN